MDDDHLSMCITGLKADLKSCAEKYELTPSGPGQGRPPTEGASWVMEKTGQFPADRGVPGRGPWVPEHLAGSRDLRLCESFRRSGW